MHVNPSDRKANPVDRLFTAASKADLFEAAWQLASLLNEAGSCDDEESTLAKLLDEINHARAARGARPINL